MLYIHEGTLHGGLDEVIRIIRVPCQGTREASQPRQQFDKVCAHGRNRMVHSSICQINDGWSQFLPWVRGPRIAIRPVRVNGHRTLVNPVMSKALHQPASISRTSRLPGSLAMPRASAIGLSFALLFFAVSAEGQLVPPRLPGVSIPGPPVGLPAEPLGTTVRLQDLRGARHLRIRELVRANREVIELDSRGEPLVRGEVLGLSVSPDALQRAQAAGFTVARESALTELGLTVTVLVPPQGTSASRALRALRRLDPAGTYDLNHIYTHSGDAPIANAVPSPAAPEPVDAAAAPSGPGIGLVDGGVDARHPVFHNVVIHSWGCEGEVRPSPHGTAVASLLVGRSDQFAGVAPGAVLYSADVYCNAPTGGNVYALAAAFSWLVSEHAAVINVSLVGPPNVTLERVIAQLVATGHVVVAAVGNDGPAAPPLYPAAYRGVIGVTGVDARRRVLLEAGRGPQVAFAAPGADMAAAAGADAFAAVRGTSFAAPIVAGLIAQQLGTAGEPAAEDVLARLASTAVDLGARGRDEIYGAGLIGDQYRVDPALVVARAAGAH